MDLITRLHLRLRESDTWRELAFQMRDSNRWMVSRLVEGCQGVSHGVLFLGCDKDEAERIFLEEFQASIYEGFYVDIKRSVHREKAFEMFHYSQEKSYLLFLESLGYDIRGKWNGGVYYRGSENSIDLVGVGLMRKPVGGRI